MAAIDLSGRRLEPGEEIEPKTAPPPAAKSEEPKPERLFSVVVEKPGIGKALYLHDQTLDALIEDVIDPFEKKEPFYIEGHTIQRGDDNLKIQILEQSPHFAHVFSELHFFLQRKGSNRSYPASEYHTRLEAVFRGECKDVTNRLLNAYKKSGIKGKLTPDLFRVAREGIELALKLTA